MNVPRVSGLRQIRRSLLVAYFLIALLYGIAIVGFLANQQATDALCALRGDLERRVASSQMFLREHPNGIAGIPAKTIQDGIRNQERTIEALDSISCPE